MMVTTTAPCSEFDIKHIYMGESVFWKYTENFLLLNVGHTVTCEGRKVN